MTQKRRWQDQEAPLLSPLQHAASKRRGALEPVLAPSYAGLAAEAHAAQCFLDGLARSLGHGACGTAAPTWQCAAELNGVLARNMGDLPGAALRGYHSFTRAPRDSLWLKLCSASGLDATAAAAAARGAGPAPTHLHMLGMLLGSALLPYPELSAVHYTFVKPPWLFGWSHKWQHCSPQISVLEVRAYAPGGAVGPGSPPVRTLFIPLFP